MLLRKGLRANADPSTIYRTLTPEQVETLFREGTFSVPDAAVSTAEKLSPVAAAHRIYTNSIAMMPWQIRRREGDARMEEEGHALERVLKARSNDAMSPFLAQKIQLSQAFWHGEGYLLIVRDANGAVTQLLPLPTAGHQRMIDPSTGAIWHSFTVDWRGEPMTRKFQESELLIHRFETYDGTEGRGLLALANDAIAVDAAAQKYGAKFYSNGARVSGIVSYEGELDDDAREIVRESFEKMATGLDNAFRVAVLDLGMKYTPLGISQKDSQFLENRTFSVDEIARFTGIPAYKLQTGKQSYESNAQQQLDFVRDCLLPPVTQMEQEWSWRLLTEEDRRNGVYLRKNVAALLRGDDESRSRFYEKMTSIGVYSPDDCRAYEDKSPLPDGIGEHFWFSKNYAPMETLLKGGK